VTEPDGTRDGPVPPQTQDTTDDTEATMYTGTTDTGTTDTGTTDTGTTDTGTTDTGTTDTGTTDTGIVSIGATEQVTRRRGPDPLALLVGLATLAMAVFAFVGELPDLSGFDPRWLLAGGAAAVGLVLLLGSLRGRSGGRPDGS
jgi:hypothetical protein